MNFNAHYQDFRQPMVYDSLDCKLTTNTFSHPPSAYHDQYHTEIEATDVLCGRGKTSFNHVGNRRFRDLIAANTTKYDSAKSRLEKSLVVHQIVEQVKKAKGRFLKQDRFSGRWYELDERQAKEKVGHAIRDATSSIDPKKKTLKKTRSKDRTSSSSSSSSTSSSSSSPLSVPSSSSSSPLVKKKVSSSSTTAAAAACAAVPVDSTSGSTSKRAAAGGAMMMMPPRADSVGSESSAVTVKSDNTTDPWDDLEPLHVDSQEAKNSLVALQKDEYFLLQMKTVLRLGHL